jgi:hypothetical protein
MKSIARFAAGGRGRLGLEELATSVSPAAGPLAPTGHRHLVVPIVSIREQLPDRAIKHTQGRLARAAAREHVRHELALGLVARDEAPEPRRSRLALGLDALRGLVGEHDLLFGHEVKQPFVQRIHHLRRAMEQIAERRVVHLDAGAPVRLGLAVERERVGALRDRDLRHERRPEARLVEDLRWSIGRDDRLAAATADLLLDVDLALNASRDELVRTSIGDRCLLSKTLTMRSMSSSVSATMHFRCPDHKSIVLLKIGFGRG